jgi:hypothetical protein
MMMMAAAAAAASSSSSSHTKLRTKNRDAEYMLLAASLGSNSRRGGSNQQPKATRHRIPDPVDQARGGLANSDSYLLYKGSNK